MGVREEEALRAQAASLASIGDFDGARAALTGAIDAAPNDPELHALMGWYSFKCQKLAAPERDRLAEHHLNVSNSIAADNVHATYWQARLWIERGNLPRARAALEAVLRSNPGHQLAKESKEAIDRLDGKTPAPTAVAAGPRRRRPAARVGLVIVTVLSLVAGGAGYWMLNAESRELRDLARQLGTDLSLRSASRDKDELLVDVGGSLSSLSVPEQNGQMQKIVDGAAKMGIAHVFFFADSKPLAEAHEGKLCADESCLTTPPPEVGEDGTVRAGKGAP